MSLTERVRLWLQREAADLRPFLPPASYLIVGVSGGPDSLVLLHVLRSIFPPESLVVAHLNHGWRAEAAAEAEFVRQTAVSRHIPCHIETADVTGLARAEGLSLEEAGRKARYDFFARIARQVGAKTVALGHNADDQAETVLMHLLRGAGLAGLQGMLPASPMPGADDLWLVRPFLTTTRAEIEHYCREHALNPITDPTNQDITYFRNRLRHELLPYLAGYNPQIRQRLQDLASVTAADYALIEQLTQEKWEEICREDGADWVKLDKEAWRVLPLSLRRSTLRQSLLHLRPDLQDVGFRSIEQARQVAERSDVGRKSTLPGGLILEIGYEHLTIARSLDALPVNLPQVRSETAVPLPVPGRIRLADHWILEAEPVESFELTQIAANPDPWVAYVDVAERPLLVRPRQSGEKIQPLGMAGHSASFKKIMINRKIPAKLRPRWPIVTSPSHPIWMVGHLLDERARVKTDSTDVIRLQCRNLVDAG